jgi:hypothetical protein
MSGRQSQPQSAGPAQEWGPDPAVPAAKLGIWRRLRRRPGWLAAIAAALLAASALFSIQAVDADSRYDLLTLLRRVGHDIAHLRWQFTFLVALLAGVHYLATAVAARAASGLSLPYGETVLVQLAGAAANRLSAAGIRGVSDLLVLLLLILIGNRLGLTGIPSEVSVLTSRISDPAGTLRSWSASGGKAAG